MLRDVARRRLPTFMDDDVSTCPNIPLRGSGRCGVFIGVCSALDESHPSTVNWAVSGRLAASTPNLFGANPFQCLEQSTYSVGYVFVWSDHREEVSEPWRRLTDF